MAKLRRSCEMMVTLNTVTSEENTTRFADLYFPASSRETLQLNYTNENYQEVTGAKI